MRTSILLLSIALLAWMTGSTWYWVCKVKGHCEEVAAAAGVGAEMPAGAAPVVPPFTVTLNEQPLMTFNNNLRFGKSVSDGVVPGLIRSALDSLAAHLRANPLRDVQITGYYSGEEANHTDFQNLGLARANFIRHELMARGVATERLIASYEQNSEPGFFALPDTLIGGIGLALLDRAPVAETAPDDATARTTTTRPQARNFYFGYNSADLPMNSELRSYISGVIQFMNQSPAARLVLTGHTDSRGDDAANLELGRKRAATMKKFFQDFGLAANRIEVASQGEKQPIATNDTEAGRTENRRVEVAIAE